MKYQVLFSLKKKTMQKYSKLSSAAFVIGALRVKSLPHSRREAIKEIGILIPLKVYPVTLISPLSFTGNLSECTPLQQIYCVHEAYRK